MAVRMEECVVLIRLVSHINSLRDPESLHINCAMMEV